MSTRKPSPTDQRNRLQHELGRSRCFAGGRVASGSPAGALRGRTYPGALPEMSSENIIRDRRRRLRTAKFPFLVSSHVLRHSCGYKLANDGQDTRAIQHYLGHRSIASTVRYTKLAPDRFKGFWKD
jgi:integrase